MNATDFKVSLKPAKSYISTKPSDPVKLRIGSSGLAAAKPITIPEFFRQSCLKYATRPALSYEENSEIGLETNWITLTYTEYAAKVERVALVLLQLGLQSGDGVGILAYNCPEWLYTKLAAIHAGGIPFGIYQTSSAEAIQYMLEKANATICIVDDMAQMEKVRKIRCNLPNLNAVIQLNAPYADFMDVEKGYYKWQDLLLLNKQSELFEELKRRESKIYPNQCAAFIFTSGTTGLPKAAMICHDSILFSAKSIYSVMFEDLKEDCNLVSYLPLSHMAPQVFDLYGAIFLGAHVHFVNQNSLKGTLQRTIIKVRPKFFFGTPRVFEKICEQINANKEKFQLSDPSARVSEEISEKIKQNIGFDFCKWITVAGAPMSYDSKQFFLNLHMPISDLYGLTETNGAVFYNKNCQKLLSVGKPFDGVELKIKNFKNFENKGEICIRGRVNFMGYLNEPEQTANTIDNDGWFHTGDLGYIDEDGDLVVTGRLKELIITSGGENIPFLLIEQTIKNELPMISNAMVIGDQRKYLTILLTLKTDIDVVTGLPTKNLSTETVKWLKSLGLHYKTLPEVFGTKTEDENNIKFENINPKIIADIAAGIERANLKALSNAQKVQKFRILPHDFSVKTGELGAILKTRRAFILEKYAGLIQTMYN